MSRYTHLTTDERKSIAEFFYQGCSTREIARRLDRNPSTISRELRRNRAQVAANCTLYHPGAADMAYKERRKRCVRKHVLSDRELHHAVHFALGHLYWSPEQICERLRLEGRFFIGTSTIYRALESGYLRDSLKPYLRRKYKTMGKASKKRRKCFEKSISERPQEANERKVPGHLEGDTIVGHGHGSCVATHVDRKARFTIGGKCDSKRVEDVNPVIIRELSKLPKDKLLTITFDQGPEFSRPDVLEEALGISVYFANAHSPWERGTNENTNGLLRQFFPKEQSMEHITQEDVDRAVALLNFRPRKCLGWRTPYEVFFDQVLQLT